MNVTVVSFGPLGASVVLNFDDAKRGLISQEEIARYRDKSNEDVVVFQTLQG